MRLPRALSLTIIASLVLAALPAFAQSTGRVTGVVRDTSGGAVPGASVTVTNDATGTARTTVSGPDGSFFSPRGFARSASVARASRARPRTAYP